MAQRRRRTAEEAREEILDAAEAMLGQSGPDGLRLAAVAEEVGVSHPTILHHFGSREGLLEAVVERGLAALQADLVGLIQSEEELGAGETAILIERAFSVLGDRGHARLVAWLVLSGRSPGPAVTERWIEFLARAVHSRRAAEHSEQAQAYEDTLFTVLLSALALFADAIVGENMRRSAGLGDDPGAAKRFRTWLAELLLQHIETTRATPQRRS
jgi:AcrR family transcriptional regulator